MADGSRKPIEQVRVGDRVIATDPETGESGAREVTRTIIGKGSKNLVDVTVDVDGDAGDRTARISATDGHPFWVSDRGERGEWVEAGKLRPGDDLRTPDGGVAEVRAVQARVQFTAVFNLTIAGIHTYFVLAGGQALLVHNCGKGPLPPGVTDSIPAQGRGVSKAYQITHAGPCEFECVGGGVKILADGLDDLDPSIMIDTKFVGNLGRSPYVPGSKAPDFIRDQVHKQQVDEMQRYAAIINDPNSPFTGLRVVTNEEASAAYFAGLMQQYNVPGVVLVKP
ncbi:polymorphic toxin-type HINT domain-containing protein [Lentzea sp. NPDC004782]|uniref:polymorphic toxin-type HINT domain-containing protein n=1 Tax=Lentzea sp. NPDC004782 TaxID=3154458 RepID=UPI0033A12633